jgi:hypothetical protein
MMIAGVRQVEERETGPSSPAGVDMGSSSVAGGSGIGNRESGV